MRTNKFSIAAALSLAGITLSGCSNPEESARAALTEAVAEWSGAATELDPKDRVAAYSEIIETVAGIAADYPETPDGRAIASGRSVVNGLSVEQMTAVRDYLGARAACYTNPTVECLTPFASGNVNSGAAADGSADAVFAAAREAVCARGFAAADRTLEPFKINRPVYAQELVQIALAAAACDKPDEVKTAIDAYRVAEPAVGSERVSSLLSIVSTGSLKPAWPSVLAELEQGLQSRALNENDAANVALTMAVRYAALGDTKAALAKYAYFTDTLNYEADWQSKLELGSTLIVAGAPAEGIAVVRNPNMLQFTVIGVTQAAAELGRQVGVVGEGAPQPELFRGVKDIGDYFAPLEGAEQARVTAAAATVEGELDKLAPVATVRDSAIGLSGIDVAYGVIAVIHQKLGAPDRASAAIDKALAFRGRLLQRGAENVALENFAPFRTLVALGQGKHAEAAEYVQAFNVRNDYVRLILRSIAMTGNVEQSLTIANQAQANNPRASYTTIIESLIEAGKLDEAETVIAAYPGNADEKRGMHWLLATQAANEGDAEHAEELATKYGLVNGPQDRLRLLAVSLNSEKVAGDRGDAEPIIREIFTIGQQLDGQDGGVLDRNNQMVAQNAAWHAFHNGYTDLGIELYTAAARKDQRPLFEAFNAKLEKRDMTSLLMLAHDNLGGAELGYVIDAAIRYLD